MPLAVPGVPVFACGDATGGLGHWTSASAEAAAVARRILGLPAQRVQPAYFWSDEFDLRLQLVGRASATATVEPDGGEESFLARYEDQEGRLVAALGANRPTEVASLRRELAIAA